ncbi:MAG: response regulator [Chitinivibrionia bacterium]|nr:response regulator [Chitinivibrionia bacterium]
MPKVFIADDSALARAFMVRCIQLSGVPDCEFFEASNGLEVMEKLKEIQPDLIITDINMPKCNGIDLAKRLKADSVLCNIPFIVMSSAGNNEQRAELEKLGAAKILSKPFTAPDVINIATDLLGKKESDSQDDGWGDYGEESESNENNKPEETEGEW